MSEDAADPHDGSLVIRHPSVWLFGGTLALLIGQAAAALPWTLPAKTSFLLLLALPLFFVRRARRWGALLLVIGIAFGTGYLRRRQILHPQFSPNHLRALMTRQESLYLEGI